VAGNGTTANKFVQGAPRVTHIKSVTVGVATHPDVIRAPSDRLIDTRSGSTANCHLLDNVGSVRALFTAFGTLTGTYSIDPFGNQTSRPANHTTNG
jgi:hypothetical protein